MWIKLSVSIDHEAGTNIGLNHKHPIHVGETPGGWRQILDSLGPYERSYAFTMTKLSKVNKVMEFLRGSARCGFSF